MDNKMNTIKSGTAEELLQFLAVDGHGFHYKFLKRGFDILCSGIGLLLLGPLLLLLALIVKVSSPGPVIYKQTRYTWGKKRFHMYKFRTMPHGIENGTPVWAKDTDLRSTKVGLYLRHLHLDELPQLINVLKGEMSLVGPRPERPYFAEKFNKIISDYDSRHRLKAGITGWAQVNGYQGNNSKVKRAKCDQFYVNNWSFLFDIKILLRTFFDRKKLWVHPLTFSQSGSCLRNSPSRVPRKKAQLKVTK